MTTAIRELSPKLRIYRRIMQQERPGSEVAWIAGIILDGKRPTTRLRNLWERLEAGQEIAAASFMMPYQCFIIDGVHVTPDVLEAPIDCDLDDYRYGDE